MIDREASAQPERHAAPVVLDGPTLGLALRGTIADLHAKGVDPRDIAMAMFGSQADREAYFERRGIPDPLDPQQQQKEAGQ